MALKRIALAVEYDGQGFCGWQRQPHCHSVQAEVEAALGQISQQEVTVYCAGRTDTGVHASAQIVHFDTDLERPLRAWTFGANSHLDKRVAIHWAAEVPLDFHARFSALDRSYRYTILNRATRPGYQAGTMGWERIPLDADRMNRAAQALLGEHDFSSFRSAECQANHAVRTMKRIEVRRELTAWLSRSQPTVFFITWSESLRVVCWLSVGAIVMKTGWRPYYQLATVLKPE